MSTISVFARGILASGRAARRYILRLTKHRTQQITLCCFMFTLDQQQSRMSIHSMPKLLGSTSRSPICAIQSQVILRHCEL